MTDMPENFVIFFQRKQITKRKEDFTFEKTKEERFESLPLRPLPRIMTR